MKGKVSVLLDAALCLSAIALIYTLAQGKVQWDTRFFKFTIKNVLDPLQAFILIGIIKVIADLNDGIFPYLSQSNSRLLSSVATKLCMLHQYLHSFYIRNKINLLILVISSMISLGFLEIYFHVFPHTLPQELRNSIASGYHDHWSGIYRYHPALKMFLMRPHYERQMYFNGYNWHHTTDAMGFRNPTDRPHASIVLLGDSMVYGHGVEETSTVRHYLEILLQQPVANLGIQGGSIHHEYQILKTYGIALKPRVVCVFFLVNDIHDLTVYLLDEEMRAFLNTPVDDHLTPYIHAEKVKGKLFRGLHSYINDFYVVKAYKFLKQYVINKRILNAHASLVEVWSTTSLFQKNPRLWLAMQFHLHTLSKMQDLADNNNFRFINVFIYTGNVGQWSEESVYEKILEIFCQVQGIHFYNLRKYFEKPLSEDKEIFLKGDGHFTDYGARVVAESLSHYILKSEGGWP